MKISVVIPANNESKTIATILEQVDKALSDYEREIIVVDDGSTDSTWKIISQLNIKGLRVFKHEKRSGKGTALRTAFSNVTGDIVIIQDADLEYDPFEYPILLAPIINNNADVVYGSRFVGSKPHRVMLFWHKLGNTIVTTLSNLMTNLTITDMETCYKVFKSSMLPYMNLRENSFGIEPELTAKFSQLGAVVYEVGISYYGRTYSEGKKINFFDGVMALWYILKYKFLFSLSSKQVKEWQKTRE